VSPNRLGWTHENLRFFGEGSTGLLALYQTTHKPRTTRGTTIATTIPTLVPARRGGGGAGGVVGNGFVGNGVVGKGVVGGAVGAGAKTGL
jgi:hypothetical protein